MAKLQETVNIFSRDQCHPTVSSLLPNQNRTDHCTPITGRRPLALNPNWLHPSEGKKATASIFVLKEPNRRNSFCGLKTRKFNVNFSSCFRFRLNLNLCPKLPTSWGMLVLFDLHSLCSFNQFTFYLYFQSKHILFKFVHNQACPKFLHRSHTGFCENAKQPPALVESNIRMLSNSSF